MEQPELNKCYVFNDERGKFAPLSLSYKGQGVLDKQWVQSNLSITMSKNTIRGLHFQNGKFAQSKLVKVVRGKVLDFIVDLRPESLHHMNVSFYDLDDSVELYVPRGFAHGFITLMDNTIVQYLVDNDYSPENEGCLNWEELPIIREEIELVFPEFNPDEIVISDKDKLTYNLPEPVKSSNEPATENIIVDLIKKYPDDYDLGRMVRRLFSPY